MKLTAILLTVVFLQVRADGLSQSITFSGKDVPLDELFAAIKKQTGYVFFYTADVVEGKRVTLHVKKASVEEVLRLAFNKLPLDFIIENKTIIISKKKGTALQEANVNNALLFPIDVRGIVVDENNTPIQGVNIMVKGTSKGTSTNSKGEFIINNVDENAILVITSVGYNRVEILASPSNTPMRIQLKITVGNLDELQVIAYGTTTKRLQTGNVSTIKAAEIERNPVSNPLAAIQGRVPGLLITQTTGVPGGSFSVQIRGRNSIISGNDPLYIIDGVPYISQNINGTAENNFVANHGNPLNYINPSDISSIEVLKDADATAIYGSRGANGVVLITTKKGKVGKTLVDVNIYQGFGKVNQNILPKWLNTEQYLSMRKEAFKNDGRSPTNADYDLMRWDTTRYTNWQDVFIGGTAHYTDGQVNISGGSINTQFLIGGGYHKESTVFPGEFNDRKTSFHFNIVNKSVNQKFHVTLTGNYVAQKSNMPVADLTSRIPFIAPNAPNIYDDEGSLNWENSTFRNPFMFVKQSFKGYTNNLISNAILEYKIIPNLVLKTSLGYNNLKHEGKRLYPLSSLDPANSFSIRSAEVESNGLQSWIIEPQAMFNTRIKSGKLNVLVATSYQENITEGQTIYGEGFSSDALLENIKAAPTFTIRNITSIRYKYFSVFGRATYNLKDKYVLNLTGRRDGSSKFGTDKRFANFGSVGFAWIFSLERFVQNSLPFLSYGKFRGSYGTSGNDQIRDYGYIDLYNPVNGNPYQNTTGLFPNNLYNPDFSWEINRKLEGALELGFLKNKILFTASFYRNRSSNQLVGIPLPMITGFNNITANLPATVQNKGCELVLSTENIKSKSFTWASELNLSIPKNKLIAFPGIEGTAYRNFWIVGEPLNILKVFKLIGVNDTTGKYQFADAKGNAIYSPVIGVDNTTVVNLDPKFYGGFQNSFRYKGFQLIVLFQFVKQTRSLYHYNTLPGYFFSPGYNQPVDVLSRWQKTGDKSYIQKFTQSDFSMFSSYSNAANSDFSYGDASFIRLKNLSLSWDLPGNWQQKLRMENAMIYLMGQNLLTITSYQNGDPETPQGSAALPPVLPPLRVITIGVKLGF